MRNALVFMVAAAALGAAAWFLMGDPGAGGSFTEDDEVGAADPSLMAGDEGGALAGAAAGSRPKAIAEEAPGSVNDPMALGGYVVRGRCVDEKRVPVQATIAARFTGQDPVVVDTDAQGRFEVSLGERPLFTAGSVFAQSDGDLAGLAILSSQPGDVSDEKDLGVIVLRSGQPLTVRVLDGSAPVPNAAIAVMGSGQWGRQVVFLHGTADENGTLEIPLVPAGRVRVLASGPEAGRGQSSLTVPQDTRKPLEVVLTEERTLDVTVVDKVTGDPVAGALVSVGDRYGAPAPVGTGYLPGLDPVMTNNDGIALVRGLASTPEDNVRLAVLAEGYPRVVSRWGLGSSTNTISVKKDQRDVRIELVRLRAVTFPLEGDTVPPDSATLQVTFRGYGRSREIDGVTAAVRGDAVVVEGLPLQQLSGVLTSDKGLVAKFEAKKEVTEGDAITFEQGHALEVRVLEADGSPVVEHGVSLRAGNRSFIVGPVRTDEAGECTLPPTELKQANILISPPGSEAWWNAIPVGTIDLASHTGIKEIRLPARDAIRLQVTLNGRPGLPTNYWMSLGGQYLQPSEITEDPSTGLLTFPVLLAKSDKPVSVQLWAEGYLTFNEKVERAALAKPIPVKLMPSASIVVRYSRPEGRIHLAARIWNAKGERWDRAHSQSLNAPRGETEPDTKRFAGLKPGRYQVREVISGVESDAFDVALGPPTEVRMDLSVLTYTEGRVELPSGFKPRQARVSNASGRGASVLADGTFRVRAARGAPLVLRVSHPLLMSADPNGTKTTGGATNVVLRLKVGASIVFQVAGMKPPASGPTAPGMVSFGGGELESLGSNVVYSSGGSSISYRVYEGGTTEGKSVKRGQAQVVDGAFQVGGLAPGTYSLWLERAGFAPKVFRGLTLAKGVKDLGTIQMSKGSAVTVKFVVPEGKLMGQAWANVVGSGYSRFASNSGKKEMTIPGLGAGTFRLQIHAAQTDVGVNEHRKVYDEEVQVDGSNDISITVPLD